MSIPGARQRSRRLEVAGAIAALATASCTVVPIVDFHNHHSEPVQILVGSDTYSIDPQGVASFDYPSAEWGRLRVCLDGSLLQYAIPHPPPAYHRAGFLRGRIRVQLGEGGRIWILAPHDAFPLSEDAEQPGPFPLVPERVGACE